MNLKMTRSEQNWVLYDVGNSAFTMLIATLMPVFLIIWQKMRDFLLWNTLPTGVTQPPVPLSLSLF